MSSAPVSVNLKRLATTFTVRDIMVNTSDLVCVTVASDAAGVSKAYPDFSTIPIKTPTGFSSYYSRDSGKVYPVEVADIVSDGTGLLELVDILSDRQFVFVLGSGKIDGYVHFSDLNYSLVKLSFYMLLEALERFALDSVRMRVTDEFLRETLGTDRFQQIQNMYKRAGDAGRSTISYLNISDILRLAKRAGTIDIEEKMIPPIKRTRDGAAHVTENLVSNLPDVTTLAQVKRQCLDILQLS